MKQDLMTRTSGAISPIQYHVPHDSAVIPGDLRNSFVVDDAGLQDKLLAMTDHWTLDLFSCLSSDEAIAFPVSRVVVDPERFIDDAEKPMARHEMGVLYTHTLTGQRLRHELSPTSREALLDRFYHPHHARFASTVDQSLAANGYCLILDCHSFPAQARAYELYSTDSRPDICLGTDAFHTPPWLVETARRAFEDEAYHVSIDTPYAGSIVPMTHYGRHPRVLSLMVEANRRLYVDESTGVRAIDFAVHRDAISRSLERVGQAVAARLQAHT